MKTGADLHLATLAGSKLPPRVANILRHLLDLTHAEFFPRIEPMLDLLDSRFFQDAEKSRNPGEQLDLLKASQVLREHRAAWATAFFLQVENSLARIRSPRPRNIQDAQWLAPSTDWTLEDSQAVDSSLQLQELAMPLEGASSLPLYLMGQRFGVLAATPAFSSAQLPLGPRQLLEAAAASCQSVFGEHVPLQTFLALFTDHVLAYYSRFLKKIGSAMEEAGILPGLAFVPARPAKGARTALDKAETPSDAASAAVFSPAGLSANHPPSSSTHTPLSWLEQPLTATEASAPTQSTTPDFRQLQQLLSAHRFASRAPLPKPLQTASSISTTQAAALLGELAQQTLLPTIREWREALQKQIQIRYGEAVGLSRDDNDSIELLELLIGQINQELQLDTPAQTLLQRLQRPLLHAVMGGHDFFESPAHPARQLLNIIIEHLAEAQSEHSADPDFDAAINRAIEQLERHQQPDRHAFEQANQQLAEQLQQQIKRAQANEKRCVEAMQGRERMALAKSIAQEALESRLQDLCLPQPFQILLRNAWLDALTLALLRYGAPSQGWSTYLARTEEILTLLLDTSPNTSPDLKREVESALQRVGYHDEDASAVAEQLSRSPATPAERDDPLAEEIASRIQAHARFAADDSCPPADPPPASASRSALEEACYQKLCTLPFGSWFDFVLNDQGETTRRRLSWYSKLTGHALFVNRRGQRVALMHLDSLATLMAQDKIRLTPPGQMRLVDRTLGSITSVLQRLLRSDIHNSRPASSA